MSNIPDDIIEAPAAFNIFRVRINQILGILRVFEKMEGRNGIVVTVTDNKIIIEKNP